MFVGLVDVVEVEVVAEFGEDGECFLVGVVDGLGLGEVGVGVEFGDADVLVPSVGVLADLGAP